MRITPPKVGAYPQSGVEAMHAHRGTGPLALGAAAGHRLARADARHGLGADRLELAQKRARQAVDAVEHAHRATSGPADLSRVLEEVRAGLQARPWTVAVAHGPELREAATRVLA
ncbi:MAG: hypothetical protein GF320_00810 [Armatimonadia bacterium]|nr:hypothetical protein [Armatimonadia bacterium]